MSKRTRRAKRDEPEILAELGDDDAGRVLLGREPGALGVRPLTVLRPIPDALWREEAARREAVARVRTGTELTHPTLTRAVGVRRVRGRFALATELISGCNLYVLAASDRLDASLARRVGARVAAGLDALHRGRDPLGRPRPLVHGSVTPDKVVTTFSGDVKLLDFAVTRTSGRAVAPVQSWPEALRPWIPPEQWAGAPASPAGDLYMLGATLYWLLAGAPPFPAGQVATPETRDALRPPSDRSPGLPPSLDDLVASLLAWSPEERPGDAAEVRELLDVGGARAALGRAAQYAAPALVQQLEGARTLDLSVAEPLDEAAVAARLEASDHAPTPWRPVLGPDRPTATRPGRGRRPARPHVAEARPVSSASPSATPPASSDEPTRSRAPRPMTRRAIAWVAWVAVFVGSAVTAAAWPSTPTARLRVQASVPNAVVTVDGRPPTEEVAPGDHVVRIEAPGHAPYESLVTLRAGQPRVLRAELSVAP